jgi:hypothetical protein
MRRSIAAIVGLAGLAAVVLPARVAAQSGCGWVGFSKWQCNVVDTVDELSPDYDGPAVSITATLQLLYDDVAMGFGNPGDPAPCIVGTTQLDPTGQGQLYWLEATSNDTGALVEERFQCVAPGEPAVPPPLPSRAEIWQATPVPQPVIHVSPHIDGLVGLDTWLWGDEHPAVTIGLSLRGWSVTGTAVPSEWVFETSDGGYYSADNPGSEDFPVGNHLFSRHGTYGISHTVSWDGGFTVSGYGFSFEVDGLARSFSAERDYDVIEIEAVIGPAGGD